MHTNVGNTSWRLPPDDTVQVADGKSKSEEDLVIPDNDEGHNWSSIVLSLFVIALVITGIATAVYLLGYVDELLYLKGKRMKLVEYLQGDLTPVRLPAGWVTHTHYVFQADDGGLSVLDTVSDTVSLLVTNHTLRQLDVKGYQCSSDLHYVLFRHSVKTVFRQSFTAHYTIYDVKNDHHIRVRLSDAPLVTPSRLQHASWLGVTHSLLLVADNDIYLRVSPSGDLDYRITYSGQPGVIYNGIPDWLYQEDIWTSTEAVWSSSDGTHIMFATFNDTQVRTFSYPWFGSSVVGGGSVTGGLAAWTSFPESRTIRYPTPGAPNPEVKLWIADVSNVSAIQLSEVKPPPVLDGQDYYLTSAGWAGQLNTQVAVVWMNRAQNISIISACLAPNWTCVETHAERALEDTWLEIQPHPVFSPDGDSFLLLASIKEGSTNQFTHIKHVTLADQREAVLSHGSYEVRKIIAWDTTNHLVYYMASHPSEPGQRHLYVVHDTSAGDLDPRRVDPQCITCDLSEILWSSRYWYLNCSHFSASLSGGNATSGMAFYVLQCEGPGLPLAGVHSAGTHRLLRILYNARPQRAAHLAELALPIKRSIEVPLSQGCRAQVQLLLPPSWRPELRDAMFPVLVEVNGRPGSQTVTEEFNIDWGTYMSSHNDVVYVKLDVRNAKELGHRALYRRFGGIEVQDQITVMKYLLETYGFLDQSRIGVWGWGYGGYVTTMVLGSQQHIFKCGIAVSPIADWFYYNSAFTERILGYPVDNFKGYVESDATQRARYIPSNSLYLLHGLADISAPYQHGVALARALADAGVIFKYQSYADEGHDLVGVIEHVYRSMEDYWNLCLNFDVDEGKAPCT